MKVPVVDLKNIFDEEVYKKVTEVLKSGMWVGGGPVAELEEKFAAYCGVNYCKAVNSGTSALLAIIGSLGLPPGSEVILPSFTFIATANCLIPFGLKPVFADIEPDTFCISPDDVEKKIGDNTSAIIAVDLYGLCADYGRLEKIASEHGAVLIEDACQAHGAEYNGKKAGSFGKAAAFSLYPTKNMFCGGEGGLITTDDGELFEKVRMFADHGQSEKYKHTEFGLNLRMTAVAGICASASLDMLDSNNTKRIENAALYRDLLENIEDITLPVCPKGYKHVYHQFTIRTPKREKLIEEFRKNGIGFGIHYAVPIHKQPFYINAGYSADLPETERAAAEVISIPVHPRLTEEQIRFTASVIKKVHV